MKNLMTLCALTLSTLTLGQDKKTQNCERTKAYVLAKKDLCADEAAALLSLDCGDQQARARADSLNSTCLKKKRPSKDGGTEHEET